MFRTLLQSMAVALVLSSITAPAAYATASHNPAGNNGVVKINDELVPDTMPENDPHVGCTFSISFYNYDKGNSYATVDFGMQKPTAGAGYTMQVAGNMHPFIGGNSAGGGTDLDATEVYTLSFTGTPQAQQGYHVKVVVDAPGSQGNDKKQKVFWVGPCTQPSQPTPVTPVIPATPTPPKPVHPTTPAKPAHPGTPNKPVTPQVLGDSTVKPVLPATLPETGSPLLLTSAIAALVASAAGYAGRLQYLKRRGLRSLA